MTGVSPNAERAMKGQDLSSAIRDTMLDISGGNALAAKARRAVKIQKMWADIVERPFLEHTNAVFVVQESDGRRVLIVYVDDSIFAAELNARRELIKLAFLERFNENLDEFRILISRGDYKRNHPFIESEQSSEKPVPIRRRLSDEEKRIIEQQVECIDDPRLRASVVKAMISDLELKSGIPTQKQSK